VIDLASRRVVGWALADHMRTELISDALLKAFDSRRPPAGAIFHSDRGCQYTSRDYRTLAVDHGAVLSLGRKGTCWDTAVAESFFATIKRELIDRRSWPTIAGVHRAIFDWIEGWSRHPTPPQQSRLPQPRPIRSSHPPKHQHPSGIIDSTNQSAKARQLQVT
jgi:putative transposase